MNCGSGKKPYSGTSPPPAIAPSQSRASGHRGLSAFLLRIGVQQTASPVSGSISARLVTSLVGRQYGPAQAAASCIVATPWLPTRLLPMLPCESLVDLLPSPRLALNAAAAAALAFQFGM